MLKTTFLAASAAAMLCATPALAGSAEGRWQVKALATGVLPDGKITKVKYDGIGLPPGSQSKVSDNVVPTLAIEYFATPNVSVETICCLTNHHVSGTGALAGADRPTLPLIGRLSRRISDRFVGGSGTAGFERKSRKAAIRICPRASSFPAKRARRR